MYTENVSYVFNLWENSGYVGSITYTVGKGMNRWADNNILLRELLQDKDKTDKLKLLIEDFLITREIERELQTDTKY
jgi:hypothetical protein